MKTINIICIFFYFIIPFSPSFAGEKKVLIQQFVEHPALNKTIEGIISELKNEGYDQDNFILKVESAQANSALATQIAAKFASQNADVVVGVGTVSAQSFAKYASQKQVFLIFSSVTDPLSAGLIQSVENPGRQTSGVSNFVPLEPQLQMMLQIQPKLKKLGILYNPGESNSIAIVKKLEVLCSSLGIELIKQTAGKTSDVPQGSIKLASTCEALFISNDNTALNSLPTIIQAANQKNIPVYVSDTDAVELGALAALGPNQFEIGRQTAHLIAKVLQGKNAGEIPVEFAQKTELYINTEQAKKLSIPIPEQLLEKATLVTTRVKV